MVEVRKDVVYRTTPQEELEADVYVPEDDRNDRPAVVLVHGGGWEADHRGMFSGHLTRLAKRGYVGADITHRLSDEAAFPACIRDVNYAIRWLKTRTGEYGVNPDRVAIGGHSSGAHIAALAAVATDSDLEPRNGPDASSAVAAALPMNGPYDLRKLGATDPTQLFISGFIRRLFGTPIAEAPSVYRQGSPIEHVDGSEPTFLLMTGTNDEEVPFFESVAFRDRLEAAGTHVELYVADGGDHVCLAEGNSHYGEGLDRIEAFLDEHL